MILKEIKKVFFCLFVFLVVEGGDSDYFFLKPYYIETEILKTWNFLYMN